MRTIQHFHDFVEELLKQIQKIKSRQDAEKKQLVELRDALKNSMTCYKEVSKDMMMIQLIILVMKYTLFESKISWE